MLARVFIELPIWFDIVDSELPLHPFEDKGYLICIMPPVWTGTPQENLPVLKADGTNTRRVNTLVVQFNKDSFERRREEILNVQQAPDLATLLESSGDPPAALIFEVANTFLQKLRYMLPLPAISVISANDCKWRVYYLNNDGSALPEEVGKFREVTRGKHRSSYAIINTTIWNDLNAYPMDYSTAPWVTLLLDAKKLLPEVGPAIVLAAASLETLMAYALPKLADRSPFPENFWEWFSTEREKHTWPTIREQIDSLLRFMTGKSLKDDAHLWVAFKEIKDARDTFVHTGIPEYDRKKHSVADAKKTAELVISAENIMLFVRDLLPEAYRWPIFHYEMRIELSQYVHVWKDRPK